jgi:transcriptional regulator with XRE-family HTH domain
MAMKHNWAEQAELEKLSRRIERLYGAGIQRPELADASGLSQSTLSKIVHGGSATQTTYLGLSSAVAKIEKRLREEERLANPIVANEIKNEIKNELLTLADAITYVQSLSPNVRAELFEFVAWKYERSQR